MSNLNISVVVVAKNAEETINDCLFSINRNHPFEIILIDGNSKDKTVEIAQSYGARIFYDKGKGIAFARQLGAEMATQEYISYIDSDIVIPDGSLSILFNELKTSEYIGVSAQMLAGKLTSYWEISAQEHIRMIYSRGNCIGLAACIIKRDTILKYQFDPILSNAEDSDLIRNLNKAGYKFGVSSAVAYHYHKTDWDSFAKHRFIYGRGKAQFLWKYGLLNPSMWAPVTSMYLVVISLIKGKPKLIPYFIFDGIIETMGMIKGFYELVIRQKY